jgi:alkylation response protein AidB-like acyl-CoA dehydrogenase
MSAVAAEPSFEELTLLADDPLGDARLPRTDRMVRDEVREVVAETIAPAAAAIDRESAFPHEGYQALAQRGLAAIPLPEGLGGIGQSMLAYAAAMEEISAACGATATVYMTQLHCAHPIALGGSLDQSLRLVPQICDGSAYGALAVTETEAGSDVAGMRTVARRDGDEYVINGSKTFITNGDQASIVVLFANTDPARGRDGVTAFVLERERDGFRAGPPMKKMGMRGSSTTELFFDDCRVPASARLGLEGSGFELSMQAVVTSRISAAAQGVGFARGAFARCCAWAQHRDLLRRRDRQELHFRLAEMRTRVAAARALLRDVAAWVDTEPADATGPVAMAKLHCTETGVAVAAAAVDLMGAEGDLVELGVERYLRDAKVTEIYDGTNQIQRVLVSRDLRNSLAEAGR